MRDNEKTPEPRHDPSAEREVLGGVLVDNGSLIEVEPLISAEDFYDPRHALIFDAILAVRDSEQPINVRTVAEQLRRMDRLNSTDGAQYLGTLTDTIPTGALAGIYARAVADAARVRRLETAGRYVMLKAREASVTADDLSAFALEQIGKAARVKDTSTVVPIQDDLLRVSDRVARNATAPEGIPTGIPALDRIARGGLHPGHSWILAARPACGKTSLACQLACSVARHGTVLVFSLEMPRVELVDRMASTEGLVDSQRMARGQLSGDEWDALNAATERLHKLPVLVDETPDITLADMRARARAVKQRQGMTLIVVDYLQLVRPSKDRDSREREVAETSRGMKAMAKELGCAVLSLSQLSRDIEKRGGAKGPRLSDLRESGAIEQDADLVAFLHVPGAQDEPDEEDEGEEEAPRVPLLPVDLIVKKHRHGPTGKVPLLFRKACTRFEVRAPDFKPAGTVRTKGNGKRYGAGGYEPPPEGDN